VGGKRKGKENGFLFVTTFIGMCTRYLGERKQLSDSDIAAFSFQSTVRHAPCRHKTTPVAPCFAGSKQ